jgi:hypothetical protein
MDFVLIPELGFFPVGSVSRKQVVGGIHFFPAFEFRGNLKLVRVRKSSRLFCHFLPPFRGGLKNALRAKKET